MERVCMLVVVPIVHTVESKGENVKVLLLLLHDMTVTVQTIENLLRLPNGEFG